MAKGRNFSSTRRQDQAARAQRQEIETRLAIARVAIEDGDRGPSKEELRAQAAMALASFRGNVKRLPTMIDVQCPCGHRRRVAIPQGRERPRFRCSRCGRAA